MREQFTSVSSGGLNAEILPMRLYDLAKRWTWDPATIDFTPDVADWQAMTDGQRDVILRLCALFQAGEEAVTLDLLPLIQVIAAEGRLEEEMYLTSFLFEEAKHVEFFHRFLRAVGVQSDLHHYHGENYRRVFGDELPSAMARLAHDPSPESQARAAVTYNVVVEGLLAETGYHAFFTMLRSAGKMPGLCRGVELTKRDESRHIAWGIYHCSRLVAEHPELLDVIHARAAELFESALGVISDLFAAYPDSVPFDLTPDIFVNYAVDQYQKRLSAIERAQGKSVSEIMRFGPQAFGMET